MPSSSADEGLRMDCMIDEDGLRMDRMSDAEMDALVARILSADRSTDPGVARTAIGDEAIALAQWVLARRAYLTSLAARNMIDAVGQRGRVLAWEPARDQAEGEARLIWVRAIAQARGCQLGGMVVRYQRGGYTVFVYDVLRLREILAGCPVCPQGLGHRTGVRGVIRLLWRWFPRLRGPLLMGQIAVGLRPKTEVFDLVSDILGDRTGLGRTDVVVDPVAAFDVYLHSYGEPEPDMPLLPWLLHLREDLRKARPA